jgi:hypothetical protein
MLILHQLTLLDFVMKMSLDPIIFIVDLVVFVSIPYDLVCFC